MDTQSDNSDASSTIVKSEDGNPPTDGNRLPPPECAICLGNCRNKSFTDSCLHQFCFKCLVTWSKVKTECPLCKQNFNSIIHNVQSNQQYEEYRVEQRRQEDDRIDIDDLVTATRRFRYRTTLTIPRGGEHTHLALQRLLMQYPPLSAMVGMSRELPGITPAALPASRRRRSPSSFRRTVYRHNLWARPLPDFTGRHRDCTPEFYRYNSSQMHRLVPWLNRELHYLLLENSGHIAYVLSRILDLLPQYHITSPEFRENLYRYFSNRTDHFLHELHCFASTPYDLTGYDRNVQYTTDSRISNTVNDVISSSDSDSGDSDIVLVTPPLYRSRSSPQLPLEPNNGPAVRHLPEPVYPQNHITSPIEAARLARTVIPIETISNSDTDDDEVMVTGYIKPPSQRTPEVVDLSDSDDSDVVVTEGPPAPAPARSPRGYVKLTLSRPRVASDSEVEDETYTPPPRASCNDSILSSRTPPPTTSAPRDDGAAELSRLGDLSISPRSSPDARPDAHRGRRRRRTRRSRDAKRERDVASTRLSVVSTPAHRATSSSPERDHREKDKPKKSNGKGVKSSRRNPAIETSRAEHAKVQEEPRPGPSSRPAGKAGKSSRRDDRPTDSRTVESTTVQAEPRPGLSRSGKAKSSRKDELTETRRAESAMTEREEPQPGPSSRPAGKRGKSRRDERTESQRVESMEARPGPSSRAGASGSLKRKNTEEIPSRRNSRETKRLKSVVKKTSNWTPAGSSSSPVISSSSLAVCSSSSAARAPSSAVPISNSALSSSSKTQVKDSSSDDDASARSSPDFFTDSDDDIPLNLTIQRSAGLS